jgi:hypothetical protein
MNILSRTVRTLTQPGHKPERNGRQPRNNAYRARTRHHEPPAEVARLLHETAVRHVAGIGYGTPAVVLTQTVTATNG